MISSAITPEHLYSLMSFLIGVGFAFIAERCWYRRRGKR